MLHRKIRKKFRAREICKGKVRIGRVRTERNGSRRAARAGTGGIWIMIRMSRKIAKGGKLGTIKVTRCKARKGLRVSLNLRRQVNVVGAWPTILLHIVQHQYIDIYIYVYVHIYGL